jgi:membrane-associated phospholipid phosphatase
VGILSGFAAGAEYFSWDLWLVLKIQAIDLPAFGHATKTATDLSSSDVSALVLPAAVAVLLLLRRFRLALFAAASAWTHLIGGTLKLFVDRTRPSPDLVETAWLEDRFSYPSGHTEWVVGFEGFLVFAVWQLTPNRFLRYLAAGVWGGHIVLTGLGRVEQGMHWPSDVLAGLLVGALALSGTVWAYLVSRHAATIAAHQAALGASIPASTA